MGRRCLLAVAAFAMACARGAGSQEGDAAPTPIVDSSSGDGVVDETTSDSGSTFDIGTESSADATDGGECAAEICGDGLDNNCDGVIDEGCNCQPGKISSCYTGPSASRGKGQCGDGTMTCVGSGEFGKWGPCTGDVKPSPEVCDPGGVDENCDGTPNEGCECSTGAPPVECGSSAVGACKKGKQACVDGKLGPCVGAIEPKAEECNNIDDDCDGKVDEDVTRACGSSIGACKPGVQVCTAGAWGACTGGSTPTEEKCNNVDDDCDGMVDEDLTAPCGSSVGECKPGVAKCTAGAFGACMGGVAPAPELCDGLDNNCDGKIDDMCACKGGETRPCGSAIGECKPGTETCSTAGVWGACVGAVGPTPEICNMKDDNCNGMIDEGDVCPKTPPIVMCPGALSGATGTALSLPGTGSDPDGGAVSYTWAVVTAPVGSTAMPTPATSATTSFTPDTAGTYTLQFCVTDDELVKSCCTVTINAVSPCTPPTAPTVSTCGTSWDRRPVIEFTPLPAGMTYQVFRTGSATALSTISMVGQNYFRPAAAISAGAAPPGESVELYLKACKADDPTCCAPNVAVTTRLVEACTTPVDADSSNVLFSEYLIDGDGGSCAGPTCEAGEAIEITNLHHCPVRLTGTHFAYCNPTSGCTNPRWMDFGAGEIVPPRGVYVAIRNVAATKCSLPFFSGESSSLFGLKVSSLDMKGDGLDDGWFNNGGAGSSSLSIKRGTYASPSTPIAVIAPYKGTAPECSSIGFNALDACGDIAGGSTPSAILTPNQLGRLWHPCDSVVSPVPACVKD